MQYIRYGPCSQPHPPEMVIGWVSKPVEMPTPKPYIVLFLVSRIGWLVVYCFTSRSRIFHLYGDVTITGEGLQNLGLCSALMPFSREGSLSCHTCCDTGPRFFRSHPKDRPILSPFTTHKGMWKIYSYPDSHGSPISRLWRHTRGYVDHDHTGESTLPLSLKQEVL
jgi:hypothetical protein